MRFLPILAGLALATPAYAGQCTAQTGSRTAALVELYTSEGCDSCPPADQWLQSLGERGYAPGRVVPLSLHVNYWDYIGWKDPYGQQRFSDRQRRMARVMRAHLVYTPQVLLQGRDFRGWRSGDFDEAVKRINARAPQASISLRLETGQRDTLRTDVRASLADPKAQAEAVLYLASYQSKLASRVSAGENRGRTLTHDYVVLEWTGAIPFTEGRIDERRVLRLLPKAAPAHSGVAAFVQNRRTGEVLQALMLPACPG